jgi:hypothetical protein
LRGKVAAAVADRVAEKGKTVLDLDGFTPEKVRTPQGSFPDEFPVEGLGVPLPVGFLDAVGKDVLGADREWWLSMATPVPARDLRDPITLSGRLGSRPHAYIYCTGGDTLAWMRSPSPGRSADDALTDRLDGPFRPIDSGHWPMITKPRELAEALIALASGSPPTGPRNRE